MITKTIFCLMMMLGMIAISSTAVEAQREAFESSAAAKKEQTTELDVACDCRTFAFNRGVTDLTALVRGDGFIVNGTIFPAGTLPTGTATNDPNDPGSIGDWICRGTLTGAAADPVGFVTQYHLLANGGGLVSDGLAGIGGGPLAVIGGMGSFSGASGDMAALPVGTNITVARISASPSGSRRSNTKPQLQLLTTSFGRGQLVAYLPLPIERITPTSKLKGHIRRLDRL